MRAAVVLLALLLAAAPVAAQTRTPAESFALLDAALAEPRRGIDLGVMSPPTDLVGRTLVRDGAAAGLHVLDTVGSNPCYAEWFDVTRMAFLLVGKAIAMLDQADIYAAALDNDARDQAMVEFTAAFGGWHLLPYADILHERTTCSPAPTVAPVSPSPTPKRTATPERSPEPSP